MSLDTTINVFVQPTAKVHMCVNVEVPLTCRRCKSSAIENRKYRQKTTVTSLERRLQAKHIKTQREEETYIEERSRLETVRLEKRASRLAKKQRAAERRG